jgi:hypothetical protein
MVNSDCGGYCKNNCGSEVWKSINTFIKLITHRRHGGFFLAIPLANFSFY